MVRKFGELFELVLSEDGVPYGVPVDAETLRVAKPLAACEGTLRRAFWKEYGETLTADAVKNALSTVSAIAAEEAPRVVVKMRSSDEGDRVVIDLGRDTGELVEITAEGWRVVRFEDEDRPDTVWTRSTALRPLPVPERGGDRTLFATAQDLDPDSDIARLLWGWLLSAYLPEVASPIAWFTGAHGSAKTTRSRNLLALVDPVSAPSAKAASETDDNVRAATRFVVSMDNVGTKISAATSDWMARIVTGFADDRRVLYTNGEMYSKFIKRPMAVTSIVMLAGLGSDAVERLMRLDLPMIDESERLTERELNERYEAATPYILGALFDDLAGVIAHRDEVRDLVHRKVVKLARMADHSEVLHALDIHLDQVGAPDGFHETFFNSVKQGLAAQAMDDPVVTALLRLVPERDRKWEGTPDDLYQAIKPFRPEDDRAGWPTSPVSLGRILKTKQIALRTIGIEVEQGHKKIGTSSMRWRTVMNVGVTADDVPGASDDAVDEALAAAEADAYRAARKEADAHTTHRILANGGRTQGSACVVERVAACDYRIFSGSGDADPSLWDARAQTYNGSFAKTWTELPIKMR